MVGHPKDFKVNDFDTIKQVSASHSQATVITQTDDGMEACHIPMYWQKSSSDADANLGYLFGHIAKINSLNNIADLKPDWLIIFQDSGHYIISNCYPSKTITPKEVPSRNYRSIHVAGKVSLFTKQEELIEILT